MKISIIIPNFNGEENLKNNLPRVLATMKKSQHETELIVVDDASDDESVVIINKLPITFNGKIKLIQNTTNLGFAASCNRGVKEAKGDVVILLNSDVYPQEDFLDVLVDHFQDPLVFAVGCLEKTLDEEGKIIGERGVGELFFKNGIFQHCAGDLKAKTTDWVCGGSGAFRRDLFLQFGGFDKRFAPFYWEDIDLSYRAKKQGYKLLFERKSVVYHQHLAGSIARKYSAAEIHNIAFRNQLKFTWKHAEGFWQKITFFLFRAKQFLRKT